MILGLVLIMHNNPCYNSIREFNSKKKKRLFAGQKWRKNPEESFSLSPTQRFNLIGGVLTKSVWSKWYIYLHCTLILDNVQCFRDRLKVSHPKSKHILKPLIFVSVIVVWKQLHCHVQFCCCCIFIFIIIFFYFFYFMPLLGICSICQAMQDFPPDV